LLRHTKIALLLPFNFLLKYFSGTSVIFPTTQCLQEKDNIGISLCFQRILATDGVFISIRECLDAIQKRQLVNDNAVRWCFWEVDHPDLRRKRPTQNTALGLQCCRVYFAFPLWLLNSFLSS
jgi:hypothetical protein